MTTAVMEPIVRDTGHGTSGVCQVVLFNDNHNAFDHVVASLISVFKHSGPMAEKITMEAHTKGRAIAEVEDAEKAHQHKEMLAQLGLMAEVEQL